MKSMFLQPKLASLNKITPPVLTSENQINKSYTIYEPDKFFQNTMIKTHF